MRITSTSASLLGFACLLVLVSVPLKAYQIGTITVCYACQNTGDAVIDAALTAHPNVATDGILFAFKNTSAYPITGGVLSVSGTSPADSFALPTIPANSEYILIPGISADGNSHPANGLFAVTGFMDTSDGAGNVDDTSVFKFIGTSNGAALTSPTAGSLTTNPGTFIPGDPGLIKPWISPSGGKTSFIGDGPDGDGGCTNCYFSMVATINNPDPPFFIGEAFLGGSIYYLKFADSNLFGYYGYLSSSILFHQDMGYEAYVTSPGNAIYFYDFASGHWWYSSASLFPYIYDFSLGSWIYYYPNTTNAGHYTTNPRYFVNLTTQKIFTM
jgi:hypothetical protein